MLGSVRGVPGDRYPYRDSVIKYLFRSGLSRRYSSGLARQQFGVFTCRLYGGMN